MSHHPYPAYLFITEANIYAHTVTVHGYGKETEGLHTFHTLPVCFVFRRTDVSRFQLNNCRLLILSLHLSAVVFLRSMFTFLFVL